MLTTNNATTPACLWLMMVLGVATSALGEPPALYDESNGLGASDVYALSVVDKTVWAGTSRGLSWLAPGADRWQTIHRPGKPQRSFVTALEPDGTLIWVGTDQGLALLDRQTKRWQEINVPEPVDGGYIAAIHADAQQVWLGLWRHGLYRLERDGQTVQRVVLAPVDSKGLGYSVYSLASDERFLYVGTNRGLLLYDKNKQTCRKLTTANGLASNMISVLADDGPLLWIGTAVGPGCYDKRTGKLSVWAASMLGQNIAEPTTARGCPIAHAFISGIAIDNDRVWFSTFRKGAAGYDKTTKSWLPVSHSFNNHGFVGQGGRIRGIYAVAVQRDQLWLATHPDYYGKGLVRITQPHAQ